MQNKSFHLTYIFESFISKNFILGNICSLENMLVRTWSHECHFAKHLGFVEFSSSGAVLTNYIFWPALGYNSSILSQSILKGQHSVTGGNHCQSGLVGLLFYEGLLQWELNSSPQREGKRERRRDRKKRDMPPVIVGGKILGENTFCQLNSMCSVPREKWDL